MSERDNPPIAAHDPQSAADIPVATAILGGTFDPVHLGHLSIAAEVATHLGYERVLFIPAYVPPHKDTGPAASASERVRMLEIATAAKPVFGVDRFEVSSGGISFTIATVRHLISEGHLRGRPGLIIGEDLLPGFDSWREADSLEQLTDIIVVRRPGSEPVSFSRRHRLLNNEELDISSRDIRDRVRASRPFRHLVPEEVARYIEANGLYR